MLFIEVLGILCARLAIVTFFFLASYMIRWISVMRTAVKTIPPAPEFPASGGDLDTQNAGIADSIGFIAGFGVLYS